MQQHSRWRIENGERVKILKDIWILRSLGFKLIQPARNVNEDTKVRELIDIDLGEWNKELIFDSFAADEAKKILSIPLSHPPIDDKLIWHHEKSGDFFA